MRRSIAAVLGCLLMIVSCAGATRACTCFSLDTPDGPIFGCNLDLFIPGDGLVFINQRGVAKEGLQASTTGSKAKWVSKYGSVTFNLAGREFAVGGINEAGLVVGSMEVRASRMPKPDERNPLTIGTWAQYVLDNCSSVEEVIALDARVRIEDETPPVHFLVADASGHCASIEWMKGKLVSHTGDELPVKAMTNMPYDLALAAYRRGGPHWWWSNPGQSAERFAAAHERCEAYDPSYDTNAVRYAFGTLTQAVAAPHTKWNLVYDVAKREVWYRSAVNPKIKHLSLADFDLSCETPLLMLDVNAPLEGDVAAAFKPYDHNANLALFRTLCARFKLDVPPEEAAGIMRQFEAYECAEGEPAE